MIFRKETRCINYGCQRKVARSGKKNRAECGTCHTAGYKGTPYPPNVKPFKTGKCSNQDGHLGFKCPIDYSNIQWAKGYTELDHIDGNDCNNSPENVQELCSLCHARKGKESGDFTRAKQQPYKKHPDMKINTNIFE